ncbi:MAG: TspO/MBR family protein [Pseudomonadota bacterium]
MIWIVFAVFFAACCAAAATGALFPPGDWYEALEKPSWTPPNWLFPIAWTVLYLILAFVAARASLLPGNALAMAFWALQLGLNALWTPVFFGLRNIGGGLVVVLALWVAVLGAIVNFYALEPLLGLLLVPYLIWVSYATALNADILRRLGSSAA